MPHNELSSSSGGTVKIIGDITYSMLLFYRKPLLVTVLPLVTNLASVIQIYIALLWSVCSVVVEFKPLRFAHTFSSVLLKPSFSNSW